MVVSIKCRYPNFNPIHFSFSLGPPNPSIRPHNPPISGQVRQILIYLKFGFVFPIEYLISHLDLSSSSTTRTYSMRSNHCSTTIKYYSGECQRALNMDFTINTHGIHSKLRNLCLQTNCNSDYIRLEESKIEFPSFFLMKIHFLS